MVAVPRWSIAGTDARRARCRARLLCRRELLELRRLCAEEHHVVQPERRRLPRLAEGRHVAKLATVLSGRPNGGLCDDCRGLETGGGFRFDGHVVASWGAYYQCPPVWSSATTLWSLEVSGGKYFWSERDVTTGVRTGNRKDGPQANDTLDEVLCWPKSAPPNRRSSRRLGSNRRKYRDCSGSAASNSNAGREKRPQLAKLSCGSLGHRPRQQGIPGGQQKPCGAAGTGAFLAVGWAKTVPVAAPAADTTKSVTNVIFLSIGSPCGLVVAVGKARHVEARPFGLPGATAGPMGGAVNSGLYTGKMEFSGARFYIRLRKRSYALMSG